MKYKRKSINLDDERKIVIGMIVSTHFLREIYRIYNVDFFQTSFAKIVSTWCIQYFEKYEKAPGIIITELFNGFKKQKNINETQIELIADFLENLSFEYEEENFNNIEYHVDQTEKYFQEQKLKLLKDNLSTCLLKDDVPHAEKLIAEYTQVKRPVSGAIDILRDKEMMIDVCHNIEETQALLQLPGAFGKLVGGLRRTDFAGILAPQKRGKSWWLLYISNCALFAQLKTLFISLEMPKIDMVTREYQYLTSSAIDGTQLIDIPYFTKDSDEYDIEYKTKKFKNLCLSSINKKTDKLLHMIKKGILKLEAFPANTFTINDLYDYLTNLEYYDNFIPDVIVIDYADILLPSVRNEYRHQLDNIWKGLRSLAQIKNCLVVTASQSSKIGLSHDIDAKDIAEDGRKLGHVTHLICLNQTKEEYDKGIMRVSVPIRRSGKTINSEVIVLQCLEIGRPYLDSKFKKEVNI